MFASSKHECLLLGTSVNIANHVQFGEKPFLFELPFVLYCFALCIVNTEEFYVLGM